jgi:hypothetical protein
MNRACVLEVPQLKDYGGQPLIFKGAQQTRCVHEDVFNHPVIQTYLAQLLLIEVDVAGNVAVPAARTVEVAEPVKVVETIAVVETPAAPVVETIAVVETPAAPVVETAPEPVPESVPAADASSVSVEDTSPKDTDDGKGFEVKRRRR